MKKTNVSNERGIGLVELMISLAASAVIVYSIFVAMRVATEHIDTTNARMTIETSAREGLYRMIQEIRESSPTRITFSDSNQTVQFTVPNPSSPVTSGYAIDWTGGKSIQYSLSDGQLIRTDLSDNSTKVLANDVTAISFTGNAASPSVVTVAMSVQRQLANQRWIPTTALQLTGEARVRNSG